MFCHKLLQQVLLCTVIFSACSFAENPWRFAAGLSAGKPTPIMATAGFGYKSIIMYVEGMGVHSEKNDFWTGIQGSLDWTLFRGKPYSIDLGLAGGYEYARAPNEKHNALNKANDMRIVFPYNYKEMLHLDVDLRIHLFGIYSQIDYPIYRFREHDANNFSWRMGYMFEL